MKEVSYSEARQKLAGLLSTVCCDSVPIYIKRKNGQRAVLISSDEYESMDETAYLLRSEANRKELEESLRQANTGEVKPAKELFDELGINCDI
jgi:antitoxin YefM